MSVGAVSSIPAGSITEGAQSTQMQQEGQSASTAQPASSPRKNMILKRHQPEYTQLIVENTNGILYKAVAGLIADYVVEGELMDRKGWLEYYGVDIGPETAEVQNALRFENFYSIFHSPNPVDIVENIRVDRIRQVCESCLIPTVIPEQITHINTGLRENFCLRTLGALAEHPQKGPAAKYAYESDALQQHGTTNAKPSRLHIMLEDVVARNKPWERESQNPNEEGQVQYLQQLNNRTGYGCKVEPEGLYQNTVIFAHYVVTGERHFGNATGKEQKWTYGRTVEEIGYGNSSYKMVSGGFSEAGTVRGSAPAWLNVDIISFDDEDYGVGVLREF